MIRFYQLVVILLRYCRLRVLNQQKDLDFENIKGYLNDKILSASWTMYSTCSLYIYTCP